MGVASLNGVQVNGTSFYFTSFYVIFFQIEPQACISPYIPDAYFCRSLQFMDRLKLLLMPAKHQPDLIYLRHVPLRKVHLFTFIQVLCLALLWILKSTVAAIIFPVMVNETGFN